MIQARELDRKLGVRVPMRDIEGDVTTPLTVNNAYLLRRLGIVMRPEPDDDFEAGGVLNPGGARALNGDYFIFPRLVARGNYSRIGGERVLNDAACVPIDHEPTGSVLQ